MFDPKVYLEQLERCDIETISHLESAINQDLNCQDLQQLCRYFNTNAGGIVRAVAMEIGLVSRKKTG